MAGDDTSIGAIRKRTTKLLADWGADFSVILKELEENRARLQELEAAAAGQSDEVETLNRRIEAQDTLIASLQSGADETATLLETSLDWHVTTVSELQQSVTTWKSQYAALKSLNPSSESTIDPEVRLWRIRLMIVTSLITLFFSLLPSALGESGLSGDNLWRPASFFLAAATATQLFLTYRWMPTSYRHRIFTQNRMAVLLTTSSVVFASAELAAACGLLPIATSAAYSWGLLYFLFLSSYHFFRLILAVQPD